MAHLYEVIVKVDDILAEGVIAHMNELLIALSDDAQLSREERYTQQQRLRTAIAHHGRQHQEDHDAYGDKQDDGGIHHGGDHLAFQLLSLFLVFRQTVQHDFQHTAEFPGFHHVDEQAVENAGMLRQSLGERGAALHGIAQGFNGHAQVGVRLLLGQHVQALEQGKPCVNQSSKLAGENHQSLGLDFASQFAFLLLSPLGLFLGGRRLLNLALARFYDLGGVQAMRPDGFHGLRFGVGLQGACFLVAFMVKCCVLIFRHICCFLSVFSW